MCNLSRFWPQEVRQRVNKTYTYFASGLAVTSLAAYATTRAHSMMRFMATRPLAVSLHTLTIALVLHHHSYSVSSMGSTMKGLEVFHW